LRARSAASPNPELCIWNSTSLFQTQLVEILIPVDCISLRFVMPHPHFYSLFLKQVYYSITNHTKQSTVAYCCTCKGSLPNDRIA
jgi:hypothetical protein